MVEFMVEIMVVVMVLVLVDYVFYTILLVELKKNIIDINFVFIIPINYYY